MEGRGLSLKFFVELRSNWEEKGVLWVESRVKSWKLGEFGGGSYE